VVSIESKVIKVKKPVIKHNSKMHEFLNNHTTKEAAWYSRQQWLPKRQQKH